MCAELSLNDPLSGGEIKEIILAVIKKRLDGDCTLMGGLAYAGFSATFDIKIGYLRSLTKPTLIWGDAGQITDGEVESAGATTVADTYVSPSPNVARQDHDLPIPVMVQTPKGPERRRVRIEKPKP